MLKFILFILLSLVLFYPLYKLTYFVFCFIINRYKDEDIIKQAEDCVESLKTVEDKLSDETESCKKRLNKIKNVKKTFKQKK